MCEAEPAARDQQDDSLQFEVYDLRRPGTPATAAMSGRMPGTQVSRRSRFGPVPHLAFAASMMAVVLSLALVTVPPVRDAVAGFFSSPPPTPVGSIEANRMNLLWQTLRQRPLKLPALAPGAPCPVTPTRLFSSEFGPGQGNGIVYAIIQGNSYGTLRYDPANTPGSAVTAWGAAAVAWVISLDYGGPVLVRGRQLDGHNPLRFNGGLAQPGRQSDLATAPLLTELALVPTDGLDGVPWSEQLTYARVRAPGCYAYQADGLSFSAVIVFRAEPSAGAAG